MTYPFLDFVIEVNRNFIGKEIVPQIRFRSIGAIIIDQYPNNAYTQMIGKEVKATVGLKTKLNDSVIKCWSVVLQKFLEKSIKEVKYPELCYYCP